MWIVLQILIEEFYVRYHLQTVAPFGLIHFEILLLFGFVNFSHTVSSADNFYLIK